MRISPNVPEIVARMYRIHSQYQTFPLTQLKTFIILLTQGKENSANSQIIPLMI